MSEMDVGSENSENSLIWICGEGIYNDRAVLKHHMILNNMDSSSHNAKFDIMTPYTWSIEACINTNVTQCDVYKRMNIIHQTINKVLKPSTFDRRSTRRRNGQ